MQPRKTTIETTLERRTRSAIVVCGSGSIESQRPEHVLIVLRRDAIELDRRAVETKPSSNGGAVASFTLMSIDEARDLMPGSAPTYSVEIVGNASIAVGQVQAAETSLGLDQLRRFISTPPRVAVA